MSLSIQHAKKQFDKGTPFVFFDYEGMFPVVPDTSSFVSHDSSTSIYSHEKREYRRAPANRAERRKLEAMARRRKKPKQQRR